MYGKSHVTFTLYPYLATSVVELPTPSRGAVKIPHWFQGFTRTNVWRQLAMELHLNVAYCKIEGKCMFKSKTRERH